ncbi:hypothetical protein V3C99_012455, partial [Haemonchus contortus]
MRRQLKYRYKKHYCHGGFGYGSRNTDGERILEYADSHNLVIV